MVFSCVWVWVFQFILISDIRRRNLSKIHNNVLNALLYLKQQKMTKSQQTSFNFNALKESPQKIATKSVKSVISESSSSIESCYESDQLSSSPSEENPPPKKIVIRQKEVPEEKKQDQIKQDLVSELQPQVESLKEQVVEAVKSVLLPDLMPIPLVKTGLSMLMDLKEGWRPKQLEVSGAPIPLYYDYEPFTIPNNPQTQKPYVPLYLGPRIYNSLDMHKQYAAKEEKYNQNPPKIYDCGVVLSDSDNPRFAYSFKFPKKVPFKLPREESEREFTGMNPKLDLNNELIFDSNFESGNLDLVIKTDQNKYDLYMRVDTNTRGHHQWFYFTVTYPEEINKQTIQFTVRNFTKDSSLYDYGMRIAIAKKSQNYTWFKAGDEIKYGRSNLVRRSNIDPMLVQYYYSLKFKYTFDSRAKSDTVCFAYCYPYTFTKLQRFLKAVSLEQKDNDCYSEQLLCKSLSGLDVPLLTITSRLQQDPKNFNLIKLSEFEDPDSRLSLPLYKRKKYVIIGSRVHPGESNGSYMMQGLIKYLLGNSHQAKQLRKRVVFKIIPISNPDGVVAGNYRTSMSGHDLNRRYHNPDQKLHPTVCAIKQMTSDLVFKKDGDSEDIIAFIDMHGHSKKKNTFIFGPQVPLHSDKFFQLRIIPKLIAEETPKFRYFSCKFRHEKSKLKAARIVMHRQFNIFNCYTYESSLHGYFDENNQNYEFTIETYEEMGEHLANSLYEYLMIIEEDERRKRLKDLEKKKKRKQRRLQEQKILQTRQEGKGDQQLTAELTVVKSAQPRQKRKNDLRPESREKNISVTEKKKKKKEKKQPQNTQNGPPEQEQPKRLQNPNEPPSSGETRNLQLRRMRNTEEDAEQKPSCRGFRTMKEMLKQIKHQEAEINEDESENEAGESSCSDAGAENDDLSNEQQQKLQSNILEAITQFANFNNISEHDYLTQKNKLDPKKYGGNNNLKVSEQIVEKKDVKKKVFVVQTKKNTVVQPNTYMNYQSNTLSIQQKRRSFNTETKAEIPSFILQGVDAHLNEINSLQRQETYNFNKKPQQSLITNLVFGNTPHQDCSPMRQNPGIVFNNEAIKQYNFQKNNKALFQTTSESKPNFEGTYFQQSFLQPINFNFFKTNNSLKPEDQTQLTQGAAIRGIKMSGKIRSGVSQQQTLKKVQQRYQNQIKTKQAVSEDERLVASTLTQKPQRNGIQITSSCLKSTSPPQQVSRILPSKEDRDEKLKHIPEDIFQRTSKELQFLDQKLPSLNSNEGRLQIFSHPKGHSATDVFERTSIASRKFDSLVQKTGRNLTNTNTDPFLQDIFVDRLFKTQQKSHEAEKLINSEVSTPQIKKFNLKKASQLCEDKKMLFFTDTVLKKSVNRKRDESLESDYFQNLRVKSVENELEKNVNFQKLDLAKINKEFSSVQSIRTSAIAEIRASTTAQIVDTHWQMDRDINFLETQFNENQTVIQQNQWKIPNDQIQPVKFIQKKQILYDFGKEDELKRKDSNQSSQSIKKKQGIPQFVQQKQKSPYQQTYGIKNILTEDPPQLKTYTTIKITKPSYQPYTMTKKTQKQISSPVSTVSPRDTSPIVTSAIIEEAKVQHKANTNHNLGMKTPDAQRVIHEIAIKQQQVYKNLNFQSYGPLTGQLQEQFAERVQTLDDQTAIMAKHQMRARVIDDNRKETGIREINERRKTGDSRQRAQMAVNHTQQKNPELDARHSKLVGFLITAAQAVKQQKNICQSPSPDPRQRSIGIISRGAFFL